MKRITLTLMLLLAALASAWAYDFSALAPTGQTLYFNLVEGGAELTHPASATNPNLMWGEYVKPTGMLELPQSVEWNGTEYQVVGVGTYAFYGCYLISGLEVPEGVTYIGQSAFNHCTDLDEVRLPSTLGSLGVSAFAMCDSLRSVWVLATEPPTTGTSVFSMSPVGEGTLHVPSGSVGLYLAAAGWSAFGETVGIGSATLTVRANYASRGTVTGSGTYLLGTSVAFTATPAEGFFLACWDDGDTLADRVKTVVADDTVTAFFFPFLGYDPSALIPDTVTLFVHDTVTVADTVHDTVTVVETIYPTFYRLTVLSDNSALGLGVGGAVLPAGTDAEVCALPLEGGRFVAWNDGSTENPRHITVEGDRTLTAHFELVGVEEAQAEAWQASVEGRRLTVRCAVGERLNVFDIQGRRLTSVAVTAPQTSLWLPAAGTYLVQVGDGAARKITVTER